MYTAAKDWNAFLMNLSCYHNDCVSVQAPVTHSVSVGSRPKGCSDSVVMSHLPYAKSFAFACLTMNAGISQPVAGKHSTLLLKYAGGFWKQWTAFRNVAEHTDNKFMEVQRKSDHSYSLLRCIK